MRNFQGIVYTQTYCFWTQTYREIFKSALVMQEISHGHNFRSIRNKMTKFIPKFSFHDILSLNSTNLLMLEGNVRTSRALFYVQKKRK